MLNYRFRVFKQLFLSQYALMLEYRAEIILWAISGILPLLMLGFWINSDNLMDVFHNKLNLIRYFISVFVVRQFTAVWVMVTFEEDLLEGKLSPFLLQPISPFWRYFFSHISEQVSRIPIVLFMLCPLFLFIKNAFWIPDVFSLVFGFVSIFWAFSLRFLLHWNFSMLCFWNEKASSFERLLLIPYIFLSGLVAPIESFPLILKRLALITPFPYFISYPSKILSMQQINIYLYLFGMISWSCLLLITSFIMWKKGVKKYSAMGI